MEESDELNVVRSLLWRTWMSPGKINIVWINAITPWSDSLVQWLIEYVCEMDSYGVTLCI